MVIVTLDITGWVGYIGCHITQLVVYPALVAGLVTIYITGCPVTLFTLPGWLVRLVVTGYGYTPPLYCRSLLLVTFPRTLPVLILTVVAGC